MPDTESRIAVEAAIEDMVPNEAQHRPAFKEILNATDLVTPDGMPLAWLGRLGGDD